MRRVLFVFVAVVFAVLLVASVTPQTASAYAPTSFYVVRPGDTLFSIAMRYGVSSWSLAQSNGIWNPNFIYVGQTLVIPGGHNPNPCPGCPGPFPGPHPVPGPMPGPIYHCSYRVQYGDTLTSIGYRLGTDPWAIARLNGIINLNWIYAGQYLRVPTCSPNPNPNPNPPIPPVPATRRNITGGWTSGNYVMQLSEAIGCTTNSCGVTGQFFDALGGAPVEVTGTVDVYTGAVSLTIPGDPPRTLTGTINSGSTSMTGQLTGVGSLTFTKQPAP